MCETTDKKSTNYVYELRVCLLFGKKPFIHLTEKAKKNYIWPDFSLTLTFDLLNT